MLLPGPEAIQLAIYIGWLMHGVRGAVMAGVLFFLPAFVLLSVLAGIYLNFGDVPLVQGIFYGIKPAVVAVVLFAAWRIGSRAIKNGVLFGIAIMAFVGILFFNIDFPWIVLAAAMASLAGMPDLLRMGEFFTKAAFLTLGGAYAVLPYVYQNAVEHFGWLTGPQMMDGLALGETTPGPLTAITAAVVGVILNLAVFFAWHTFWPKATATAPFSGPFDAIPVVVAIACFIALGKYKADIMKVIGACALLGLALALVR